MKLVFASSPSHEQLKKHLLLGTRCEPWDLVEMPFDVQGNGDFSTPMWQHVVMARNERLLEIIRRSSGEVLVFADVDIQWFRPVQGAILRELADKDVVFQREMLNRDMANCGFAAIRCNERSAALYGQIITSAHEDFYDQDVVNGLIANGTMPCSFGLLPPVFFNDNLDRATAPSDDRLLMYHSIGTFPANGKSSVQIKWERHIAMRARVLGSDSVFRGLEEPSQTPIARPVARHQELPACNYFLITNGCRRCGNLILHPNGRLYGDTPGLGCTGWSLQEGRIVFFDHAGRARFIFEKDEGGNWAYEAPKGSTKNPRRGMLTLEDGKVVPLFTPSVDYRLEPHPSLGLDKQRFEMVIAKYMEDVSWADGYLEYATVYSKDQTADAGKFAVLPNLGREGGTYLFHIWQRYHSLAEQTLFLQGDPFPHPTLPICEFGSGAFVAGHSSNLSLDMAIPWAVQRIDRPVMEAFLRLLECDPELPVYRWTQGAQFAVSRQQIHKRSRAYYQRLFELTQQPWVDLAGRRFDNHHVAWLFELFWRYVFLAEKL